MKTNLIFIAVFVATVSCKKETEMVTTTVQIRSSEYFSDDSIGKVDFQIKEPYTSSVYGLNDSTNNHGVYFGSFEHPVNKTFELIVTSNYFNPFGNFQLEEGKHNAIEISLIDLATLTLQLDCSGTGYVQSINCYPMVYYTYGSPLYGHIEGQNKNFLSGCGDPQYGVSIFPGQWIMSYQWKPTSSASWTSLTDTLNIESGQNYVHTIVY